MNLIVPFTKDVKFKTTLGDIVSISLEHEYNINDDILLGNFIVAGSYKTHELSANVLDFSYTLPFDLNLSNKIVKDSFNFKIDNFTYEIIEPDTLRVNIDFLVKAIDEKVEEKPLFEAIDLNNIDDLFNSDRDNTNNDNIIKKQEDLEESKSAILDIASNNEESFVTLKVHKIKEEETKEIICKLYEIDETILNEYNSLVEYKVGDKILIPLTNE